MFRLLYVDQRPDSLPDPRSGTPGPGMQIGFAFSLDEALAQSGQCDVVVVSARIPDGGAVKIVRAVAQARPELRILVKDLAESHQTAAPYMEAGAAGWLL